MHFIQNALPVLFVTFKIIGCLIAAYIVLRTVFLASESVTKFEILKKHTRDLEDRIFTLENAMSTHAGEKCRFPKEQFHSHYATCSKPSQFNALHQDIAGIMDHVGLKRVRVPESPEKFVYESLKKEGSTVVRDEEAEGPLPKCALCGKYHATGITPELLPVVSKRIIEMFDNWAGVEKKDSDDEFPAPSPRRGSNGKFAKKAKK